jgi:hypothetical protein
MAIKWPSSFFLKEKDLKFLATQTTSTSAQNHSENI